MALQRLRRFGCRFGMHPSEGASCKCQLAGLQQSLLLTLQVYFSNGVQIIPPHDAGIAAAIQAEQSLWDLSKRGHPVTDPLQEVSGKHVLHNIA